MRQMKERLLWKARISKLISCHVVRSVENYVRFDRGHGANVLSILKAITLSSSGESRMAFMDRFDNVRSNGILGTTFPIRSPTEPP